MARRYELHAGFSLRVAIPFAALRSEREARQKRDQQRLARSFLLSVRSVDVPSGLAAGVIRLDGELIFFATPRLDDVDLKPAALACAVKTERLGPGDDSEGISFSQLRSLRRTCMPAPRGLARFVDEKLLGQTRRAPTSSYPARPRTK